MPKRVPATMRVSPLADHARRVAVRSIAARVTMVIAILDLLSGVLRFKRFEALLHNVVPVLLPGASSAGLIIVAAFLLVTARGLRRGSRLAWLATLVFLGAAILLHVAKGFPVLEPLLIAVALGWLMSQGRCFPVQPTHRAKRVAVVTGIVLLVAFTATIAAVAYWAGANDIDWREFVITDRLWHRPAVQILVLLFLVVLLWSLLSPHRPRRLSRREHLMEREHARAVVDRWGTGTLDYFALRDDKDWFFVGDYAVAHSVRSGVCLVSPDPVGPPGERVTAWAEFLEYAAGFGWSVAVVGASADWLPVYEEAGLRSVYLGDEAVVDCTTFTLEGRANRGLRQAVARVERAGYTTTITDPLSLPDDVRRQVLQIATQSRHGETERGFSMTLSRLFDPQDRVLMSVTAGADGRVDAFCQWVPAPGINGWSLDVMRRRLDAQGLPNGLLDTTIVHTIGEVVRRGERGLALNFAVMRQVLQGDGVSRFDVLTRPLLQRLSNSTQMASLGQFNEKFSPSWIPRYVVLDSAEYVATQALTMAEAEGVTEIPVIGRFLGAGAARHAAHSADDVRSRGDFQ